MSDSATQKTQPPKDQVDPKKTKDKDAPVEEELVSLIVAVLRDLLPHLNAH